MKVLHVNNVADVPNQLVRGLVKLGVDAELYQPYIGGFSVGKLGKVKVATRRLADIKNVADEIKRKNFELVHIHYAYFGLLGVLGRFPFWLHCHGTDVRRNLNHPLYKVPTVTSLKKAERVLYSTPDLKTHIDRIRTDGIYLPNPIDTDAYSPLETSRLPTPVKRILLISRIEEIKGAAQTFAAASILKKRFPKIEIAAPKWGPELAKYESNQAVDFFPRVPYEEMASLINGFDIVVGQTKLGILSMSELEAMACAKPLICHFAFRESYQKAPPTLEARTADEIVEHVERLIVNPEDANALGNQGRDWVVENHNYLTVAQKLLSLYQGNK